MYVLEDVVFCNCNLKDADFTGAKFKRVAFITTNTSVAKNLILNEECHVYRTYPKLELMPETEKALLQLSEYSSLYKYGVLFVNIYGYASLRALIALKGKKNKRCLYSVHSYMKHIENYLKL